MGEEVKIKKRYNTSRANLLAIIAFTALNIILILLDADISFLFSASVPQVLFVFGMVFDLPGFCVFAVLTLGVYLLCYFLSKKKSGWMIFALVWFILDWLGMIFSYLFLFEINVVSILLDLVFHIWMTYYLIIGVKYGKKYCEMGLYEKTAEFYGAQAAVEQTNAAGAGDTAPLHVFEEARGRKIYIQAEYNGMKITVSRRKGVTELSVNGFVYAEEKILMESAGYSLSAVVNNVTFLLDVRQQSFYGLMSLYADGQLIGEKKRF